MPRNPGRPILQLAIGLIRWREDCQQVPVVEYCQVAVSIGRRVTSSTVLFFFFFFNKLRTYRILIFVPLLYRSSINFLSFLETCDVFRRMYASFSYPYILRFCLGLLLKLRHREDISSKSIKNKEHKRHHIRSS